MGMRDKVHMQLAAFTEPAVKEPFLKLLSETEDWLYDEGENVGKGVYIAKLEELQKIGNPIVMRSREFEERPQVFNLLGSHITQFIAFATSKEEKYAHITQEDRDKVLSECQTTEAWMRDMQAKCEALEKHANPPVTVQEIRSKGSALYTLCNPIMNKPKPAPPKPKEEEKKPASPAPGSPKTEAPPAGSPKTAGKTGSAPGTPTQGAQPDPMDIEK
eukprot:GFYU01002000.1.p2 GENE.GFYU01002000.1~~GFYU01002000.1.p2  ORF type:complete len:217 (-),score=91.83 GFYU01002000.1:240-890(-)